MTDSSPTPDQKRQGKPKQTGGSALWRVRRHKRAIALTVLAALLAVNAALLVQLGVTGSRSADLRAREAAAAQFLALPAPDIAAAQSDGQRWLAEAGAAQSARALPKADWQVVEAIHSVARDSDVTLQFGGTLPGKVATLNSTDYISVPVSVGARGPVTNVQKFLSDIQAALETLDIQHVAITTDSELASLVLRGAVYWEREQTPPADQASAQAGK